MRMVPALTDRSDALSAAGRRPRVLLVTYPFPPVGGAGVQRVTKFVKYLPRHGWDVSVLTVTNPSVPLQDNSLGRDVPAETVIRRARSLEPGYAVKATVASGTEGGVGGSRRGGVKRLIAGPLRRAATLLLQPDSQILWRPGAVAAGRRLLAELPHDAILASGPPFSTFLIAAALARRVDLPLVLDYRDEWTISNEYWENKRLDPLSRAIQQRMQRRVLRAAQAVVATTRASTESLAKLIQRVGGTARASCIYNGFDPEDFAPDLSPSRPDDGRFRLTYAGTLWNLTSVAPLVEAVNRLVGRCPALAARLELVFAGRRVGSQAESLAALRESPCCLVEHPYLDHEAVVRLMRESDALCLLLSDLPGVGRVVPAKLFEYMAASRPVLTIAPRGEAWELLESYPGGRFVPADVDGIADWLASSIAGGGGQDGSGSVRYKAGDFTREHQAQELAELLGSLAAVNRRVD
jgi:glycosyltransferase involved in cell wall biosynthesis